MNSATWTMFFALLIGASYEKETGSCPTHLNGRYVKAPVKIDEHSVCGKTYSNRSCCSDETLGQIESKESNIFNIRKLICDAKPSAECEAAMLQLACLLECSPDLGRTNNITSSLKDVPICKRSCEWLYNECKDELSCTKDWVRAFGGSTAPCEVDFLCDRVGDKEKMFGTADIFCNTIMGVSNVSRPTLDVNCFDVITGKFVEKIISAPPVSPGPYQIFKYIGMAVMAIAICLAMFYAVTYVMKKHRLSRGL